MSSFSKGILAGNLTHTSNAKQNDTQATTGGKPDFTGKVDLGDKELIAIKELTEEINGKVNTGIISSISNTP